MYSKLNIIVVGLLIFSLIGTIWFVKSTMPKIGYARTGFLLEKYEGMAEAKKMLESKISQWEANVDSLDMNYQKTLDNYNKEYKSLKDKERLELKQMLERQYNEMGNYAGIVEKQALDENQKLTQGVLNQINNYIKKYSEQEDFDLILGVTNTGNILYGSEAIDVTDLILEGLNNEFKGRK